jgi:hypothetical protein
VINIVWLAFGSGALVGAAFTAFLLYVLPAIREWRADRRAARVGNIEVIDLATARLERGMRRGRQ